MEFYQVSLIASVFIDFHWSLLSFIEFSWSSSYIDFYRVYQFLPNSIDFYQFLFWTIFIEFYQFLLTSIAFYYASIRSHSLGAPFWYVFQYHWYYLCFLPTLSPSAVWCWLKIRHLGSHNISNRNLWGWRLFCRGGDARIYYVISGGGSS